MLVLSRKESQSISFDGLGITVQILKLRGGSVRVGVEAPLEVRVVRNELLDEEGSAKPAAPSNEKAQRSKEKKSNRPSASSNKASTTKTGNRKSPGNSQTVHKTFTVPESLQHQFLNELNAICIGLHLYEQEQAAGNQAAAEQTLAAIRGRLEEVIGNPDVVEKPVDSSRIAAVANPKGLTALIVEDQPNEREMLAGVLRMHGYQVATTADGEEAMNYLDREPTPDVILMDMRMPRLDGPATVKKIRHGKQNEGVKIFAISGSTPEVEQMAVASGPTGVDKWFHKPLDPALLVTALEGCGVNVVST